MNAMGKASLLAWTLAATKKRHKTLLSKLCWYPVKLPVSSQNS